MGLILFWLLCFLAVAKIIRADLNKIPEIVNFNIPPEKNEEIQIKLVRSESFLANKNVPVWMPSLQDPTRLEPLPDIMKKLTPFTVYRDPTNCATALYYHKQKQFDGSIGHHHLIWKLKYNPTTGKVEPTADTIFPSLLMEHNENRLAGNENQVTKIKRGGNIMRKWTKSLLEYPKTVYVETLVLVDYGILKELQFDYTSIVSYVLTLFNSVDMVYSQIAKPNIKINIAGIILGTTQMSFYKLQENSCYERSPKNQRNVVVDGLCAINAIRFTLDEYQALPTQSYDIAIFLTKFPLVYEIPVVSTSHVCTSMKHPTLGLAALPNGIHGYTLVPEDLRVGVIGNPDIFKLLPTTAHEIAHLLGVPHDEGPLWTEDGTCDAHLMKKDNSYCKKCFKFGGRTPEYLREFFGSREACTFHNEPRSLNKPSKVRPFWSGEKQCKCYGYKAAFKPDNTVRSMIDRWYQPSVDCKTRLKCINENGQIDETAYYMDGSPCDRTKKGTKVCWNKTCLRARWGFGGRRCY